MKKHIEELTLANVDFLYIDATNGFPYISVTLVFHVVVGSVVGR